MWRYINNNMLISIWIFAYVTYINVYGLPLGDINNDLALSKDASNDLSELNERAKRVAGDLFSDAEGNVADGGLGYEFPTARIKVTVMKRSRRYWEPWELNYDVCPPSICTANDEMPRPRGTGGSVFYNGDIVLDKESEKIIYGSDPNRLKLRYKRATMRSSRTWRNATIPYMFAEDIAPKSKSVIRKAMKRIEDVTCIKFRPKKLRDVDYVRYISEPGCWSSVGRIGGEQKLSIGLGCERIGTAIHEISHVLGFWHEQARPDRDKYVRILKENISPRYLPDFNVANKTLVTSRGFPYDYESVMHYSNKAFTNMGDETIKVIGIGKKLKMRIGQRDALSTIDIAQLRDMYKCTDKKDDAETYCPKGWKKNIRSCYKFEDQMKEQFAGALKHCENLNSKLLFIDDENEDKFIKRQLKSKYPEIKTWRAGARVINGTFVWYTEKDTHKMDYTNWKKGHPAGYSSMALVYNKKKDRVRWEGVWLGSYTQMPEHAYPFICERRARRKCIPGKYQDGRDYQGTMDHTVDGYTCQKWSSVYPWMHKLPLNEEDGLGDHNYCRNPSGDRKSRPWCYTTKSKYKWQYCDVSVCSSTNSLRAKDSSNKNQESTSSKNTSGNRRTNNSQEKNSNTKAESVSNNRKNNSNNRKDNSNNRKDNSNNRKDNSNNRIENSSNRKGNSNTRTNAVVRSIESPKGDQGNKNERRNNNKKDSKNRRDKNNDKPRDRKNRRKNSQNKER